jgi:hypothetical protein
MIRFNKEGRLTRRGRSILDLDRCRIMVTRPVFESNEDRAVTWLEDLGEKTMLRNKTVSPYRYRSVTASLLFLLARTANSKGFIN